MSQTTKELELAMIIKDLFQCIDDSLDTIEGLGGREMQDEDSSYSQILDASNSIYARYRKVLDLKQDEKW